MGVARFLGALGRILIAAGVLILLFVVYQLWGTSLREAQAQNQLEDDFAEVLEQAEPAAPPTTSTTAQGSPDTTIAPLEPVPEGDPVARLVIPKIGVDKIVVEGVSLPDLKKGPGHYPGTPLLGQEGNAAIAGHRTTYGAPFHRLDELAPGDEVIVETVQGEFRYLVQETQIVAPSAVAVLEDKGDNRLTLTACHPKYSARQRIVVVATLAPDEVPLPRPTRDDGTPVLPAASGSIDDIDGEGASALPVVLLGLVCGAIWLLAWGLARQWRRWPAYALGLPFFLVALYYFFEEFSRLLPSSF